MDELLNGPMCSSKSQETMEPKANIYIAVDNL